MQKRGFLVRVLRGLLGGALGGLLWAALAIIFSMGFAQGWWYWLTLGYLFQGLPAGVIIGALTGTIIWIIDRAKQIGLGHASRVTIGTVIGMIAWFAGWWLTSKDASDYVPTPWHLDFLWIVFFGVAIGGIAGIMVGTQHKYVMN
jgi:hypothetical protein